MTQIALSKDELITLAVLLASPYTVSSAVYWAEEDAHKMEDLAQRLIALGKRLIPLGIGVSVEDPTPPQ